MTSAAARHPILFPVLEDIEFCSSKGDIVSQHEGEVFVCNPDTGRVYMFYHRELGPDKPLYIQELMPTQIPSFAISKIAISPKGQKLLMWGDNGMAVLEIPKRRRAKGATTCRCTVIGERFFLGHTTVNAADIQWHPGSPDDTHIVALTSDNILRIYSTEEPACALASYPLYNTDNMLPYLMCLNVSTGPSLLSAQAGSMVSFSFGQALDYEEGEEPIFPVFVLEENSDVYTLHLSLYNRQKTDSKLRGPLKVFPTDNENYELDACSLLCLQSNPPVLVIATLSGTVQHLALLQDNQADEKEAGECLYLLETVELELPGDGEEESCSTQSIEETSVLTLMSDPTSRDRYFVRHGTGIHSIYLPAVQRLEHFVRDDKGELNLECECVAEHMLCVQPVGAGDPTCLYGSTIIQDTMLGSHLLVLISNAEFISLPLRSIHRECIPLLSGTEKVSGLQSPSPMKQVHTQLFSSKIQNILSRSISNPLLRCGNSAALSQKALLELLIRSTQVFREEYIGKQSKARGELLHHMSLLQEQHTQHKTDLSDLQSNIRTLQSDGAKLSERSHRVSKRQQIMCQRVTQVMRELQGLLPTLSSAELSFKEEMTEMSRSLKPLQQDARQLNEKLKFQTRTVRDIPILSDDQQGRVRAVLNENDSRINSLVSKLKAANAQILT